MKITLLSLILLIFSSGELFSHQVECTDRDVAIKHLKRKYNEEQVSITVTNNGELLERYESKDGKTWSLIITNPFTKISCLITSGTHWQKKNQEEEKEL